jgi:protease-4
LAQYERYLAGGIAMGRKLSVDAVRKSIAKGPFLATEAKAAGFVDDYAFDDQIEKFVQGWAGRDIPLLDDHRSDRFPKTYGNGRRIALVYVDGDMVDGRSITIPLLGEKLVGSYTIVDTLKKVREDPNVGAVVLRIESGGGSSMAADVMWRAVDITAKAKPVIVSMAGAAASGGYYIAAPGTHVFANPLTVTGSIGIFYGKADISELLRRIGVNVETYKTAPRADAESIFRPFTPDERRELEHKIGQFYDLFLSRVADGRKMTKKAVDAVGEGRVWTGEQARDRHLVDELGGLRQALAYARRAANLPEDAPIVELPEIQTSLIGRLLGLEGVQAKMPTALPPEVLDIARALAPFAIQPPDQPLAHIEMVKIGP